MEQTETRSTYPSGMGTSPQQESTFGEREYMSSNSRSERASSLTKTEASQDLARALDRLMDRLPSLSGESLEQAKAEFLEQAAKSSNAAAELAARSADVARRVTGRVKNEWETGRERAETMVHANPIRALGVALGIGVVLGARLFGGAHRHSRDM
ncbi:hypothetical protein [Cupriavidus necator]|uniref:hypothetical protein n=1 Tax=Cupriavidus necator TaxID=106590 RepID=UPI00339D8849